MKYRIVLLAPLFVLAATCARAQVDWSLAPGEVWVDPKPALSADGTTTIPGGNTIPVSDFSATGAWYNLPGGVAGQWNYRSPFWASPIEGYQRDAGGNTPNLQTTITGLNPNTIYRIGLVNWDYFPYGSSATYNLGAIGSAGGPGLPTVTYSAGFTAFGNYSVSPPDETIATQAGYEGTPIGQGNYLIEHYLGTVNGASQVNILIGGGSFIYTGLTYTPIGTHYAGDLNNDNSVNMADYSVLKSEWLQSGTGLPADLNGDNTVNILDFAIFKAFYLYNNGGGGSDLTAPVPEPATLLMAATAVPLGLALLRRHRRRVGLRSQSVSCDG